MNEPTNQSDGSLTVGSHWSRVDRQGRPWSARIDAISSEGPVRYTRRDASDLSRWPITETLDEADFRAYFTPAEGPTVAELDEAARLDALADAGCARPPTAEEYVAALAESTVLLRRLEPDRAGLIERAAALALSLSSVPGTMIHADILGLVLTPGTNALGMARSAFATAPEAVNRPTLPMPVPAPVRQECARTLAVRR